MAKNEAPKNEAKVECEVVTPLKHEKKVHEKGARVTLGAKAAAHLEAKGVVKRVEAAAPAPTTTTKIEGAGEGGGEEKGDK